MTDNPWVTIKTRLCYENPWIRVEESEVFNPAGEPGIYGVVHFKSIATAIVPVFDDGTTLLVGQYRYPLGRFSWEIPEGGAGLTEGALVGARRELAEETGLAASDWLEIGRFDLSNSVTDETGVCFVAWNLAENTAHPDPDEKLELRRLPYRDALAMVMDQRITDMLSVVAIMKLEMLRLSGALPARLTALLDG